MTGVCRVMVFFDTRRETLDVEVDGIVLTGMALTISKSGRLVESGLGESIVGFALSDSYPTGCLAIYDEKRWYGKRK